MVKRVSLPVAALTVPKEVTIGVVFAAGALMVKLVEALALAPGFKPLFRASTVIVVVPMSAVVVFQREIEI